MTDQPERHPRDITDEKLARAMSTAARPDLLDTLVRTSREAFGFFTAHFPHTINYPWVLERLEDLPFSSRILDLGAGISPMPLLLARRGYQLDCIDGSALIRTLPVSADWNEWGFFDYSTLEPCIQAINCACAEHRPLWLYDRIYSISVLAHMPADVRAEAIRLMCSWMRSGAHLLLSVDVMPSSDFIWNRSAGVEIASPPLHGTVQSLCDMLSCHGLRIAEKQLLRSVHTARTDLLLLDCVLHAR